MYNIRGKTHEKKLGGTKIGPEISSLSFFQVSFISFLEKYIGW